MVSLTQQFLVQLFIFSTLSRSQTVSHSYENTVFESSDSESVSEDKYEYVYEENQHNTTDLTPEDQIKHKRDKNSKNQLVGCRRKDRKLIPHGTLKFDKEKLVSTKGGNVGFEHHLDCPHISCPKAEVTWFKGGKILSNRKYKMGQSKIKIRKNGRLTISMNRRDDDGYYTCVVKNPVGSINHTIQVKSSEVRLNQKPVIKEQLENATVLVGANVTLTCESLTTDNVFPRTITWYRHFKVNGSYSNENNDAYGEVLETIQDTRLNLKNLQVNDSTYYTCKIENHFGQSMSTAFISVVESLDEELATGMAPFLSVVLVMICVVCVSLLACSIHCCMKSRRSEKEKKEAIENARTVALWTKKVIVSRDLEDVLLQPLIRIEKVRTEGKCNDDDVPVSEYEFQEDPVWEYPREMLNIHSVLGEGAFGKVMLVTAKGELRNGKLHPDIKNSFSQDCEKSIEVKVAVKTVKEGHTDSDIIDLVKEMEIMKMIGRHPNIINLLGVCSQPSGSPLLVIVEYAKFGNLREFLKLRKPGTQEHLKEQKLRKAAQHSVLSHNYLLLEGNRSSGKSSDLEKEIGPVSLKLMLSFALQVAKGMEFLSARRCVHRDLAARNVLVAENFVLKIADFGMARDLQDSDYYRKEGEGRLPIKWMAPESLFERISTTMSDVWSFGILFWEIVTFGDTPYREDFIPKVFLDLIRNGYIMKQPLGCPDTVYQLMKRCWAYQAEDRPGWEELVSTLYTLHTDTDPEEYLDLNVPELDTPPSSPDSNSFPKTMSATTSEYVFQSQTVSQRRSCETDSDDGQPILYEEPVNRRHLQASPLYREKHPPKYIEILSDETESTYLAALNEKNSEKGKVQPGDLHYLPTPPYSKYPQQLKLDIQRAEKSRAIDMQLPTSRSRCGVEKRINPASPSLLKTGLSPVELNVNFTFAKEVVSHPSTPETCPLIYTAIRPKSPGGILRYTDETSGGKFSTFFPNKNRGSSESGYGTNRDSESSDTRGRSNTLERIRHASDSDSVFLRSTPSPPSD